MPIGLSEMVCEAQVAYLLHRFNFFDELCKITKFHLIFGIKSLWKRTVSTEFCAIPPKL